MEPLKLAPPSFPVQWSESPAQSSFRKAPGADWPGEAPTAAHYSTAASVEWSLKTDREAYISSLGASRPNLGAPESTLTPRPGRIKTEATRARLDFTAGSRRLGVRILGARPLTAPGAL